jgi:multidrug efflux pump subunit AcrA (membrane-fusion protein)
VLVRFTSVIMAVVLVGACIRMPEESGRLGPPLIESPEAHYDVVEAKRKDIESTVSLGGRLVPAVKDELFFKDSGGRLIDLHIDYEQLIRRGVIEVEEGTVLAQRDLSSLDIQVERQRILLQMAQNRDRMRQVTGANKYELENSRLEVKLEELELVRLRKLLRDRQLVAPFDGVVTFVGVKEGDYVEPFQPILTVADPDSLLLECVGQRTYRFRVGMKVNVEIRQKQFQGTVVMTTEDASAYEGYTDGPKMKVRVDSLPSDLAMDTLGMVTYVYERSENAVVVPKDVVHGYEDRVFVTVLVNGLKEERDVELGVESAKEVEIVRGVQEGDLLVRR